MSRDLLVVDIPCGQGGVNRSKNIGLVSKSDLAIMDGITGERDMWEKEMGASKINSATMGATSKIRGSWEFVSGAGVLEEIAMLDDGATAKLVTVDSTGIVKTLKSGMTSGGNPVFAEGWDGTQKALYYADGKNMPQVYSGGATTSDIPGPPADWSGTNWPTVVCSHNERLCAAGNANFPHTVYLSEPGTFGSLTGGESGLNIIYPGEGEKVVGLISKLDYLYIFKYPKGIYILDTSDASQANWQVQKISGAIGIGSYGGALPIDTDILLFGADGLFYAMSQLTDYGEVTIPPLLPLETSQFIKEEINLAQLSKLQSVWYGYKRKAIFVVPGLAATENNRRIEVDMHVSGIPKVFYSKRDNNISLGMRRATASDVPKPVFGDDAGFLWDMEKTNRNKDSAGYNAQYETPPTPLISGGQKRANLRELEVIFQPQGNWDLTMEVHRDGVLSQTTTFSMQTPGAAAGSISLDADVLAGNTVANTKRRLEGDARYVKLIGRNNTANQNFAVMNHMIKFKMGNNRP